MASLGQLAPPCPQWPPWWLRSKPISPATRPRHWSPTTLEYLPNPAPSAPGAGEVQDLGRHSFWNDLRSERRAIDEIEVGTHFLFELVGHLIERIFAKVREQEVRIAVLT